MEISYLCRTKASWSEGSEQSLRWVQQWMIKPPRPPHWHPSSTVVLTCSASRPCSTALHVHPDFSKLRTETAGQAPCAHQLLNGHTKSVMFQHCVEVSPHSSNCSVPRLECFQNLFERLQLLGNVVPVRLHYQIEQERINCSLDPC